jgi:hypothetical protein
MGHATVEMTMRYLPPDVKRDAVTALERRGPLTAHDLSDHAKCPDAQWK